MLIIIFHLTITNNILKINIFLLFYDKFILYNRIYKDLDEVEKLNFKVLFKVASIICLIGFYLFIPITIFVIAYHIGYIWFPETSFTKSFGIYEPMVSYLTITFTEQPELIMEENYQILSFFSSITLFLTGLILFWVLYKLFQNIHKESLFVDKNVILFYWLGWTMLILGTISFYLDGLLFDKTLAMLEIENATVSFSNIDYIESIFSGITCLLIGAALKTAVKAIEENKYTI